MSEKNVFLTPPPPIILHQPQVFDTILDKCALHCEGAVAMEPMKLSAHKQPTAMTMSQQVRHTLISVNIFR